MQAILQRYRQDRRIQIIKSSVENGLDVTIGNVHGGLFAVLIASLRMTFGSNGPRFVVCPDPDSMQDDLEVLGIQAHILPELEDHDDEDAFEANHELLGRRLRACESWAAGQTLLATSRAAEQPVPKLSAIQDASIEIHPGDRHDLNDLAELLCDQGYHVTPLVEEPGSLSQRGGVLDIWPWAAELPIRLEFFDDEVESIRRFEPDSQETVSKLKSVRFTNPSSHAGAIDSLWNELDEQPIIVLGDAPLRTKLSKDHGRTEIRLAKVFGHGDIDGASTGIDRFKGDLHRDLQACQEIADEDISLTVLCRNSESVSSHEYALRDHHIAGVVEAGRLSSGWRDQDQGLIVLHDFELAHRQPNRRKTSTRVGGGSPLASLSDLRSGDYIVHLNHGIGRFRGMTTLERRGFMEDFLLLEFAEESKTYLPVSAIDLVQKYIGGAGRHPPLDRLGGKTWSKRKAKAEKAIADLSAELIESQAKRQAAEGIAHSADTSDQRRFEASFPFEETEDQLAALREIKASLEATYPMDRLLCGDVGFGKTEIALRAAFKVVQGGHQVAVLAPTTILADQHMRTFEQRLAGFGVKVACMNRFRSAGEKRTIFEEVRHGNIDILIGTHALLNKQLTFAALGLLIVDEEQRFGVRHKEHLRTLRHGVDVLTLSATPIPRTLHFSMLGLRDISILAEAPAERLAVQTRVSHWDKALLRQALERELDRDGQVFVINNRIEDLDRLAFRLGRLVPDLRYEILHGRMSEKTIHDTMQRFRSGQLQCLIATTIVESGLDIPNANTLIVHNAHAYGLGELHQLRGRIGRFTRQAYAFFVVPEGKTINNDAKERLDAIQEYAELGAGFKLAMRDLELRGAGNILGAQQSGHIEAIGYELYCRLLNEAVQRLRGNLATDEPNIGLPAVTKGGHRIGFAVDAYIPDEWLEAPQLKFELHKLLENSQRHSDLVQTAKVFRDRFGSLPLPVNRLFLIHGLNRKLAALHIRKVELQERQIRLRIDGSLPQELIHADMPELLHVQPEQGAVVLFLRTAPDSDQALELLCRLTQLDISYLGVQH